MTEEHLVKLKLFKISMDSKRAKLMQDPPNIMEPIPGQEPLDNRNEVITGELVYSFSLPEKTHLTTRYPDQYVRVKKGGTRK